MAVGDVVNGISAANTILDFQPAAGVECLIISLFYDDPATAAVDAVNYYNGSVAVPCINDTVTDPASAFLNIKLAINNTNYLRIAARGAGEYSAYGGYQTK